MVGSHTSPFPLQWFVCPQPIPCYCFKVTGPSNALCGPAVGRHSAEGRHSADDLACRQGTLCWPAGRSGHRLGAGTTARAGAFAAWLVLLSARSAQRKIESIATRLQVDRGDGRLVVIDDPPIPLLAWPLVRTCCRSADMRLQCCVYSCIWNMAGYGPRLLQHSPWRLTGGSPAPVRRRSV